LFQGHIKTKFLLLKPQLVQVLQSGVAFPDYKVWQNNYLSDFHILLLYLLYMHRI